MLLSKKIKNKIVGQGDWKNKKEKKIRDLTHKGGISISKKKEKRIS
jgi:hypothetical protein